MKQVYKILIYAVVAILSLCFFIYLSFPYGVLKEKLAAEVSYATGLSLKMNDLGPKFLLGLEAQGVELGLPAQPETSVRLQKIHVQLSLLSLLIGRVKVSLDLMDHQGGELEVDVGMSFFDLLSSNFLPSSVSMQSENFSFGNFVVLYLKQLAASPQTSPFIRPLLEKVTVAGQLNSEVDLSINTSDISASTGTLSIELVNALVSFDPSMQIPNQQFQTAMIKASSQNGVLTIDPASKFVTRDLNLELLGKVTEKNRIEQSVLDLQLKVRLFNELKDTFSVIINAIAGKSTDGDLIVEVKGPLVPGPDIQVL